MSIELESCSGLALSVPSEDALTLVATTPIWVGESSDRRSEENSLDGKSDESEIQGTNVSCAAFLKPLRACEVYSRGITLQRCSNVVQSEEESKRVKLNGQETCEPFVLIHHGGPSDPSLQENKYSESESERQKRKIRSRWNAERALVVVDTNSQGPSRRERDLERLERARIEDPKKAERILANRQSAERSRARRLNAISALSKEVSQLKAQKAQMEAEMSQLKGSLMDVTVKTHELVDALNSKTALVDALKEALASSGQLDTFNRCCESVAFGSTQLAGDM